MIQTSWSIKLEQQPVHAALGKLPEPSILYQSASHHLRAHTYNSSSLLPIRKDLLGIQILRTEQSTQSCKILYLTRYQLTCLDLINNNEVFTLQFENAQKLHLAQQCILVVCGSYLHCYSFDGQEIYVNYVPCSISCVLPRDDGTVIVGMTDMTLIQYKGVNVKFDYGKVSGAVCCMDWMGLGVLVGTEDGTIAYYDNKKSKWKAKANHKAVRILNYRTEKGHSVAIVARSNGLIELREWAVGITLSKIKAGGQIIQMKLFDYRQQGFDQVICIVKNGDVKAYNISDGQQGQQRSHKLQQQQEEQEQEQDNQDKDFDEVIFFQANLKQQMQKARRKIPQKIPQIPPQKPPQKPSTYVFDFQAMLVYEKGLILLVTVKNGWVHRLSFVDKSILPIYNHERESTLKYTFPGDMDFAGELSFEAVLNTSTDVTIEQQRKFTIVLPKLWKWGLDANVKGQISGNVKFNLNERNARYLKWMHSNFLMSLSEADTKKLEMTPVMRLRYFNWYEKMEMELIMSSKEGKVQIWCDSLKVLGDIVQDLVSYVGVKDLDSELHMPREKEKLKQTLEIIQKLSQTKTAISSEMAEAINTIKFLLVKGQSARMVGSIKDLRKSYGQVMEQNRNLIAEISKKGQNTKRLTDAMKDLGLLINQTSNVRHGQPKSKVVAQCRQAIKNKDFVTIIGIMERGASDL